MTDWGGGGEPAPSLGGAGPAKTGRAGSSGHLCSISTKLRNAAALGAEGASGTSPLRAQASRGSSGRSRGQAPGQSPPLLCPSPSSDQASGCLALWVPGPQPPLPSPLHKGARRVPENGRGCPQRDPHLWPSQAAKGTLLTRTHPSASSDSPRPLSIPPFRPKDPPLPHGGPCPLHTASCLAAHRLVGGTQPRSLRAPPLLKRLPSWPECCRWSCRSHPNTRSFELPFFLPFCRDFMVGAQASGPATSVPQNLWPTGPPGKS